MSIQVVQEKSAPATEEKKEPVITVMESFTIIVETSECRCSVVATGDVNGVRRVFTHERCKDNRKQPGPEHEKRLHELAQIAQKRMRQLIGDVIAQREPV